jgi:hypothetical protein
MKRRGLVRAGTWLTVLLAAAACGSSAATTTSAATVTTTATTSAAIPSEQVAAAFFEAWRSDDRETMERLSEPAALAEADGLRDLISEPWEPELCEGAAGTVHCIWISEAGTLAIGVRNIEEPHLVTSFGLVNP